MVYKWYILPIGGLYATYHLLGEPETIIEMVQYFRVTSRVVKYDFNFNDTKFTKSLLAQKKRHVFGSHLPGIKLKLHYNVRI